MRVRSCLLGLLVGCVDPTTPALDLELSATTLAPPAAPAKLMLHAGGIADQYIVVLDGAPHARMAGDARRELDATIDRVAVDYRATIGKRYTAALRGFSARMSDADARRLADDPEVRFVEQDTIVYASGVQSNATFGIDRVDQRDLPLNGTYSFASAGAGTTVFVIDTGINTTHVEFTGRIRADLGGFVIEDGNGIEDCNGHGSHVSGTIGGTVFGIAKQATIVPIRVLDCEGSGASSGVIAGMDFVAENHPARSVVNMSLGGDASAAQDAAVANLVASGVTVVVAAGNETQDACNVSPAREPSAITVGATTNTDARAGFSNFGSCVDVFAPGQNITSAWIGSDTEINTISGTSMASPHVAGTVALFLAQNPTATPAQATSGVITSATPNKVSDVRGSPNRLLFTSFTGAPPPPPPGGSVAITSPADGATVASMFDVLVDASSAISVELAVDGVPLVVDNAAPFAFTVQNAPAGTHTVEVTATDAAGETATQAITVTVQSGGFGGGNNPVPPVSPRDSSGCSSTRGGSVVLAAMLIALLAPRRRRYRPIQ